MRQIIPSAKSLPGMKAVIDEFSKVWISDEVPFGFVKGQGIQTFHMCLDSNVRLPVRTGSQEPQEYTSEVVEFSY
jgi:hypothetical protein